MAAVTQALTGAGIAVIVASTYFRLLEAPRTSVIRLHEFGEQILLQTALRSSRTPR